MSRAKLCLICLLCAITAPVLLIAMACQAAFGSTDRALSMAIAHDVCGNALFGGSKDETISTRTGNGLIAGKRWAKFVAPVIDSLFGAGHCLSNATIKQ
ncbi:hypothetical protein RA280_19870 [Cupriavidus sp. CV2]|uniref:hypothetical protein n=1 Tax=Cupriavidus ulmosensis TaxID=3065913 RepID=UPI00296B1830|nr:hypothetical protein [Cupriavidus sp. CV2]MDW3683962.1 hypothetical protein [Cupriavidus sp. CV2]